MKEIWKWIPCFVGRYDISTKGRIRSYCAEKIGVGRKSRYGNKPSKFVIGCPNQSGYLKVRISHAGDGRRAKTYLIHRLVLETFVGPCPIGMECRHLDGNRSNNKLTNLQWGTRRENAADCIKHGRHMGWKPGIVYHATKLSEHFANEIRRRRCEGESVRKLAHDFDVSQSHVYNIIAGKTWHNE